MWFTRAKHKVKQPVSFDRQLLNHEIVEIIQSSQTKRTDIVRDFEANKSHYVEMARQNGSKHPASDAYLEYKSRLSEATTQREHQLHKAYQQHGLTYENERHKVKHMFNLQM